MKVMVIEINKKILIVIRNQLHLVFLQTAYLSVASVAVGGTLVLLFVPIYWS